METVAAPDRFHGLQPSVDANKQSNYISILTNTLAITNVTRSKRREKREMQANKCVCGCVCV